MTAVTDITATVIADSACGENNQYRLTTMALRYPRMIHDELMTHRVFSRNASSARAVPVAKMIEEVLTNPAVPMFWSKNQKGMASDNENYRGEIEYLDSPETAWLAARNDAVMWARKFDKAGYHKQVANRLLIPFMHINVIVSSTTWENWDRLRIHPAAEPHIRHLAIVMREARCESTPESKREGNWHLPYITADELAYGHPWHELARVSSARCARVSYKTFENKQPNFEADLEMFKRNLVSDDPEQPPHASPCEHPAMSDPSANSTDKWGNFQGFAQYRKFIPNESGVTHA